ncbi:MAG: hypothetical protein QOF60_883 [Actinomycetota bacterium]|jgi:predicted anti-sigma-YlaC factor YlaD|nr:hypothetical protein [Actinomycetota bacterium]
MLLRCAEVREALSARIDGEDVGIDDADVDAHVATCEGCRSFAERAGALDRRVRLSAAPEMADLSGPVLAAFRAGPDPRTPWRTMLGGVAAVQLVIAIAGMVGGGNLAGLHVAHELAAWELALALGFAVAAWRPERAAGMLPLVAVVALCLLLTSSVDIAEGRAAPSGETAHLLELLGFALLWTLSRRQQEA